MKKILFILSLVLIVFGCKKDTIELSDADQLLKDTATIDTWLAANSITAQEDPSGLRYVITTTGTGAKPKLTNKVTVKYTGKFLKETVEPSKSVVFDQATTTAVTFTLSGLIKGWQIGFQLLPKGSKATLYIPSGLGYGKQGFGSSIPPNSNLFFDVELVDVK